MTSLITSHDGQSGRSRSENRSETYKLGISTSF